MVFVESRPEVFPDRVTAGLALAKELAAYRNQPGLLVLGLPRGGIPVAHALATELGAPLDVLNVRKLGVPGHEELAFGAIASGGLRVLNDEIVREIGLSPQTIDDVTSRERAELERRDRLYRRDRPPVEMSGRVVVLVDDGLATGSTMRAAIGAVRTTGPKRLIVAVPVAPADTCEELRAEVDEVHCLTTPEPFYAVGPWYADFTPTTDEEVRRLLDDSAKANAARAPGAQAR